MKALCAICHEKAPRAGASRCHDCEAQVREKVDLIRQHGIIPYLIDFIQHAKIYANETSDPRIGEAVDGLVKAIEKYQPHG